MTITEKFQGLSWNKKMEMLRNSNDWTQETAAEKCNTHKKIYWLWETGKSNPRKNSRIAIAKAFGVSEDEIFGDKEELINA